MKKIIPKFTIIFLFIMLLFNRETVSISIRNGFVIWVNQILPSLFPFFIFSDMFISKGIADDLCKKIGPIFAYVFNTSKYSFFIFFISLVSGSPTNAKNIKNMLDRGYILREEAEKILCFTCFFNPFLIYSITSLYLTKSDSIKIIIITYITNLIIGLILRHRTVKINHLVRENTIKITLISSIKNNIITLLYILGTIITMLTISALLRTDNVYLNNLLNGFLEITTGLINLGNLSLSYTLKLILTSIYLSFGGISIHMQIKSILKDALSYKMFYITRILSIIISLFLFDNLNNSSCNCNHFICASCE